MRILANYGYKNNGDSYSVTFETTGDVPMEKAPDTVDDLYRLAKEAIQRQIAPKAEEPDPLADFPSNSNGKQAGNAYSGNGGNGKGDNNGKNGNGKITQNQKKFLYRLMYSHKKLAGDEATAYLKKEFKVQYVNEIPYSQADLFIQKILQENPKRGGGNGSYKRQPNESLSAM